MFSLVEREKTSVCHLEFKRSGKLKTQWFCTSSRFTVSCGLKIQDTSKSSRVTEKQRIQTEGYCVPSRDIFLLLIVLIVSSVHSVIMSHLVHERSCHQGLPRRIKLKIQNFCTPSRLTVTGLFHAIKYDNEAAV